MTTMRGANSAQIPDVRWHCLPRFTSKLAAFPSRSKSVKKANFEANETSRIQISRGPKVLRSKHRT